MSNAGLCPHCGQPLPRGSGYLTPREVAILTAWWMTDSVRAAAELVGIAEQTAKNALASARRRNGVDSNAQLLALHQTAVANGAGSQLRAMRESLTSVRSAT